MLKKKALVLGGGGFIGNHLINLLKSEGFWVRGVDLKFSEYNKTLADDFLQGDLRNINFCEKVFDHKFNEVYQLAANMGGAGFIFTGENDADIMHNSVTINLNVLENCKKKNIYNIFYSSSACVYPEHNQMDPNNPLCAEDSVYPANPDSEYGWEKLFSERLYLAYAKNYKLNCKIARYHNIFGPLGTWNGGREKAPAALCRKIAKAKNGESIDIWGDGLQTRSFLFIDDCLEATTRLLRSDWSGPVNIGSEQMVTINQLAQIIMQIANKQVTLNHIKGPLGVRGRNSDNRLIKKMLKWHPKTSLKEGLERTYNWIDKQVNKKN
jgi:nucleoside-diphosphate-sugar epimerase